MIIITYGAENLYLMFPKANQYLQTKKPEPADYIT